MTELDLDELILKDKRMPVPGLPQTSITLTAAKRRASLEGDVVNGRVTGDDPPHLWAVLSVAALVAALGVAWVLENPGARCLLIAIPSLELVALKILTKEVGAR